MKRIPTIIAVIISILLLLIPVFCLWILAAFSDLESSFLVPIVGVLLVVLIGLVTFSISNKIWLKKSIILLSVIILSLFGAMEGENLYKHKYIPSISVSNNIGWYGKYMPFTNSKELSHLDKESSLHFSKDDKMSIELDHKINPCWDRKEDNIIEWIRSQEEREISDEKII